jgi:glycosyltransferase involved in cell wall biosynthesis
MNCPSLKELPSPPAGKTGWPWTEESPHLPELMEDSSSWPKISIITPNYNNGQFIEETIRSVLLQGYPNLEYIIIDGGSNDNSISIIKKYEKWLAYWISEPDRGQSHAINKAFFKASGDVMNWLNSDDLLLKNALKEIGQAFHKNPNHVYFGSGISFNDTDGTQILTTPNVKSIKNIIKYWNGWFDCLQSSVFFSREAFFKVGALNEKLGFVMDNDLYCRLMKIYPIMYLTKCISKFRRHDSAKTCSQYNEAMLEHIKNSYKHRFLLSEKELKTYKKNAIIFVIRRIKLLLSNKEYTQALKYFNFCLKISMPDTFLAFVELFYKWLKKSIKIQKIYTLN